jgi:hypothetical protein
MKREILTAVSSFIFAHVCFSANGTFDVTFNAGAGIPEGVTAMFLQTDGGIVIAGNFSTVDGKPRNGLARLSKDGMLDPAFDPLRGAQGAISAIAE